MGIHCMTWGTQTGLCNSLEEWERRQWRPTPVPSPGEYHGRRSLVGCSPWGREESDTTEQLHFHFSLSCIGEGNGNPLQCSCLENPRDRGAWWAAISGVAQSQTQLKWLSSSSRGVGRGRKWEGGPGGRGPYTSLWLTHPDVGHPQAVLCILISEHCSTVPVTEHGFYTWCMCALACMYIYIYIYICLWLVDIWKV